MMHYASLDSQFSDEAPSSLQDRGSGKRASYRSVQKSKIDLRSILKLILVRAGAIESTWGDVYVAVRTHKTSRL